jgi:cytochrome P450
VFIVRSRFYRMLTLAIAAETFFGAQVKQDIADVEHSSSVLTAEISTRFRRLIFIPDGIPIPGNLRYRRALGEVERLVARIVARILSDLAQSQPRCHRAEVFLRSSDAGARPYRDADVE